MSKADIIKIIETIDELLEVNREQGDVYTPTTQLLMDLRNWWADVLSREYGVFL